MVNELIDGYTHSGRLVGFQLGYLKRKRDGSKNGKAYVKKVSNSLKTRRFHPHYHSSLSMIQSNSPLRSNYPNKKKTKTLDDEKTKEEKQNQNPKASKQNKH